MNASADADYIREPERNIPLAGVADVLVVGGGPAGLAAAVASARAGARTALVERYGFLGGMATAGLVGPFAGVRHRYGGGRIVGGIPWELIQRLASEGGALLETFDYAETDDGLAGPPSGGQRLVPGRLSGVTRRGDVPFDPELLKWTADRMAVEAGVELYLHEYAAAAMLAGRRVAAVVIEGKSGRRALRAKTFIDCSGDADLAALAGAGYERGRPEDGALQPMSLIFRLGGVDTVALGDLTRPYIHAPLREKAERAAAAGELPQFGGPWTFWGSTLRPGEVMVNMVRLWGDATDSAALSRNEVAGRDHVRRFIRFLRAAQPEFRECRLIDSAAQIGIRETRRIEGDYRLTEDDIQSGRRFADSIALGGHVIDIHSPTGTAGQTRLKVAPYQIPYRCLLPRGLDNLLVAGRPISASHAAHASLRVMGTAMATGQAAGVAAALAVRADGDARAVDTGELRQALGRMGGLFEAGVVD